MFRPTNFSTVVFPSTAVKTSISNSALNTLVDSGCNCFCLRLRGFPQQIVSLDVRLRDRFSPNYILARFVVFRDGYGLSPRDVVDLDRTLVTFPVDDHRDFKRKASTGPPIGDISQNQARGAKSPPAFSDRTAATCAAPMASTSTVVTTAILKRETVFRNVMI